MEGERWLLQKFLPRRGGNKSQNRRVQVVIFKSIILVFKATRLEDEKETPK